MKPGSTTTSRKPREQGMAPYLLTKTEKIPYTTICGKAYADSILGWTRGNVGALHAQEEHFDQCNVRRFPKESPESWNQVPTTWKSGYGCFAQMWQTSAHTARSTVATIHDLSVECFTHPPYSPDLPPCDFHVFRPLKQEMRDKSFWSYEEVQQAVDERQRSKLREFCSRDIHALPKRWNTCTERNGDYIEKWSHCVTILFNKLRDKNI